MARIGLRLGDLLDGEYLDEYLPFLAEEESRRVGALGGGPVDAAALRALCERWAEQLRGRIVDSYPLVRDALRSGETVILEGQLGAMRDIDWGIYPYVTSSGATAAAGAATAGVPPAALREVVGVVKAFATSVGEGPLVTEVFGQTAEYLRSAGESETEHEYGATTGRPASLRLVRRRRRPPGGRDQRLHRPGRDQAGHPGRAGRAAHRHGLRAGRADDRLRAQPDADWCSGRRRSTRPSAAGRSRPARCGAGAICRPRRGPTPSASRP